MTKDKIKELAYWANQDIDVKCLELYPNEADFVNGLSELTKEELINLILNMLNISQS